MRIILKKLQISKLLNVINYYEAIVRQFDLMRVKHTGKVAVSNVCSAFNKGRNNK